MVGSLHGLLLHEFVIIEAIEMKQALFLVLMFVVSFSFSQSPDDIEITVGKKEKLKYGEFGRILEERDGFVYSVAAVGTDFFIKKYSSHTMELVDELKIDGFKHERSKVEYVATTVSNEGYHLLLGALSGKSYYLVDVTVSRDGDVAAPLEVAKLDGVKWENYIEVRYSKDYSKVLVFVSPENGTQPEILVLDENAKMLWNDFLTSPVRDEVFSVEELLVTNEGRVLMSGFGHKKGVNSKTKKESVNYAISLYTGNGSAHTFSTLEMGKKFQSLRVIPDEKSSYVALGFYSDEADGEANSIYYAELDEENLQPILNQTITESTTESERQNLGFQEIKNWTGGKGKEFFECMMVRDGVVLDNGNILLVSERQFVQNLGTAGSTRYFREVLLTCFDSKGKLIWMRIIPRYNEGEMFGGVSFSLSKTKDRVFLLVNGNDELLEYINTKSKDPSQVGSGTKAALGIYIDEAGGLKAIKALRYKDYYSLPYLKFAVSPHKNELMGIIGGYGIFPFYMYRMNVER